MEGLALFADRQIMLPAKLIGDLLHLFQIPLAHSEFLAVQHIDGVHQEVVMDVILVNVGHNHNLVILELGAFLHPCHANGVGLLVGDALVLMPVLGEVLVGSSIGLAVQLLDGLHFFLDHIRIAMDAGDQIFPCFFRFGDVVDCPTYTSFRSDCLNCRHVFFNSSCISGSSFLKST